MIKDVVLDLRKYACFYTTKKDFFVCSEQGICVRIPKVFLNKYKSMFLKEEKRK